MAPGVQKIVVVGGGTAGWMTAAALSKLLAGHCSIELVESEAIGTIGVGEATIPHIREFNDALGIDENDFIKATHGSFKLGIEFVNWGERGERYIHGFGRMAQGGDGLAFHHFWLRMQKAGLAKPLAAYSINTVAPLQAKFLRARADMAGSPLADIAHAFHFDASLYAQFLQRYAQQRGVTRLEGKIQQVKQRNSDGFIESLSLDNGQEVAGDFFIDCSGMHGLLIEKTLHAGYEDWSHWLPCDRAIAVPCESAAPLLPMTRSTAHTAGWQWRIPLQHRTGNGHVFSSSFMGEDEATAILMSNLDGAPKADPRPIRFLTGRRKKFWSHNCVAVGLASGFLEPLESTSIHLVQTAISRIASFFPAGGFDAADIDEYNRQTTVEYEHIRDFLIAHYKVTRRSDSEFWNYCANMSIPDSLRNRLELFAANGRIYRQKDELFAEVSWLQVLIGQGLVPRGYHAFADLRPQAEVAAFLGNVERVISKCVDTMPAHADYISQHCAAG